MTSQLTAVRNNSLTSLFSPASIAVVGASESPGKLGAVMADAVSHSGADIHLVNPRSENMYPSIEAAAEAAGGPIDLAILCVPAAVTAESLRAAADSGVRSALICAGGFAEAGGEGIGYQQDVEKVIEDTGIRVLGPNTSGFFVPHRRLRASFVPGAAHIPAGRVGVISSSGGVNHAISFRLQREGVGVSLGVGLGAGIDVSFVDVIDHLADDPETGVIAVHLETVPDGVAMMSAVRRASALKPVVALVVGENDVAEFAQSHTGALATSWRTTRSALAQAGAVIVEDEGELVDAAIALSHGRLAAHPDPGVALITGQAGPGLIIADRLNGDGVAVPPLTPETVERLAELLPPLTYQNNPVDTGRPGPTFPEVIKTVAEDPGIQAVGIYGILEPVVDFTQAATEAGISEDIRTVISVEGDLQAVSEAVALGEDRNLPVVVGPTALARGLSSLVADARAQYRQGHPELLATAPPVGEGPWDEATAKQILASAGIAVPASSAVTTREEAREAFSQLRTPLAVKLLDATVLHKTEVGGVHLNIREPKELEQALDALESINAPQVLLEEMAPSGIDLVVGAKRDEVFGPVVLVGLGGTAAEALADVSIRVTPVTQATVDEMVDELLSSELLFGWRGGPDLDTGKLGKVLATLGQILHDNPALQEIEINPLRLTKDGLICLDAVITENTPLDEA